MDCHVQINMDLQCNKYIPQPNLIWVRKQTETYKAFCSRGAAIFQTIFHSLVFCWLFDILAFSCRYGGCALKLIPRFYTIISLWSTHPHELVFINIRQRNILYLNEWLQFFSNGKMIFGFLFGEEFNFFFYLKFTRN